MDGVDALGEFVDLSSGALMFDALERWSPSFAAIWRGARVKWVEPLRMSPLGV